MGVLCMCFEDSEVFCMTPRQTKWPCGIPKWHSFSLLWPVVVDFEETYSIGRQLFSDYSCTFQNIAWKTIDPDVIWTRNLLIWSQTRYRCATESPCWPFALNRIRPMHNPSLLWIQSAGAHSLSALHPIGWGGWKICVNCSLHISGALLCCERPTVF